MVVSFVTSVPVQFVPCGHRQTRDGFMDFAVHLHQAISIASHLGQEKMEKDKVLFHFFFR